MPGSRNSIAPSPMPGSKRSALPVRLNSPMAAAAVADVQGAVVEKGVVARFYELDIFLPFSL